MGGESNAKQRRRDVRRVVSEHVAINVIEMHKFIRRGFWARMRWLFLGR